MTWHDLSILVHPGTPPWPGDTPFDCRWAWQIAQGASVNVSCLSGSPHVGTHADAPLHVRDGAPASEWLPTEAFRGEALVVDVRGRTGAIEVEQLALPPGPIPRLLLQTGASIADGAFPDHWPALSTRCIRALAERGLQLLGVDCPSVDDRESKSLENHHALFGAGACVLENLDLRGVPAGPGELLALPMRLRGLDAAPVRALFRPRA